MWYWRRCHHCWQVASIKKSILKECPHCGAYLASYYYFDESKALGLTLEKDVVLSEEYYRTSALPLKDYPSIRGLTVIWQEWEVVEYERTKKDRRVQGSGFYSKYRRYSAGS